MPSAVLPAGVSRWRPVVFAVVAVKAYNSRHGTNHLRVDFE
ncbi:hypothetical protein [Haloferax sp. Atlit-12N]|nr:hypothetical protein [Haloferax sp. Atlit-12N]